MFACRMNFTRLVRCYYSTASTYDHGLVRILSQKEPSQVLNIDDALQRFNEMLQTQPPPLIIQFTRLIQSVVNMRHYSTALKLIDQMKLAGIPVEIFTFNISIDCYCRLNKVSYGFALLATIFKQGHSPDFTTYNKLTDGILMSDVCESNQIMFGSVISGLCKAGHTSKAFELVRLMEASSSKPCVNRYNGVIDSLCKDKMVYRALELFSKITEKGVLADVITYNSLVPGVYNFGRGTEAPKLLRDMEEKLINSFCKKGFVKDAELLVQAMLCKGMEPNVATYNALIDGYCLRGDVDKAKKLIDRMVEKDLVPNIITYNSLINGYCKKKRIDEAMHLFQEIQNKGMILDVITYNTMLQGLFKSRNPAAARELFKEMQAKGVTPDVSTYNILFHGMCKNNQCCDALAIFRSMGYKTLIFGCRKHGKPNLAIDLIDEILMKGFIQ